MSLLEEYFNRQLRNIPQKAGEVFMCTTDYKDGYHQTPMTGKQTFVALDNGGYWNSQVNVKGGTTLLYIGIRMARGTNWYEFMTTDDGGHVVHVHVEVSSRNVFHEAIGCMRKLDVST